MAGKGRWRYSRNAKLRGENEVERLRRLLLLMAVDAGKDVFQVGLCVLALFYEVLLDGCVGGICRKGWVNFRCGEVGCGGCGETYLLFLLEGVQIC